jgi:carboxyl-terminal processing protease
MLPQWPCAGLALLLAACTTGAVPAPAQPPPAARSVTADVALLTFDSAWSRIAHTHYDTAWAGVDWPAVRDELRPRAASARTIGELRAVIVRMLERLGESHFVLIPAEAAEAADALGHDREAAGHVAGDAGLRVRLVDGELLVWQVDPGGPAAAAGVRTGWSVEAIGGRPLRPRLEHLEGLPAAEQRLARLRLQFQVHAELEGDVGAQRRLRLRDGSGRSRDIVLVLRQSPGELVRFGSLPPMRASLSHERVALDARCVGLIRMNVWMVPLMPAFDRAIDATRDCAGMVIDLRGNPGGVAGMVMGTAGHFIDDTVALGVMRTRTSELRLRANPRRVAADGRAVAPYAGPVAILVDELTVSTSELFAAGLQGVGRARVFGSRSAGQALPAMLARLPTGDVLMHAIADYTGPGGVRIEGDGVLPDVLVKPTRTALLAGVDPALDAALDWIRRTTANLDGENGP